MSNALAVLIGIVGGVAVAVLLLHLRGLRLWELLAVMMEGSVRHPDHRCPYYVVMSRRQYCGTCPRVELDPAELRASRAPRPVVTLALPEEERR